LVKFTPSVERKILPPELIPVNPEVLVDTQIALSEAISICWIE
jgi:hypothetical protein